MRNEVDLTRPCDACGEHIGGGYSNCRNCDIWLCFYWGMVLIKAGYNYPLQCQICGNLFEH